MSLSQVSDRDECHHSHHGLSLTAWRTRTTEHGHHSHHGLSERAVVLTTSTSAAPQPPAILLFWCESEATYYR